MRAAWGAALSVLVLAACAAPTRRPPDISNCGLVAAEDEWASEKPLTGGSQFYLCDKDTVAALNAVRPQATENIALADDTAGTTPPDLAGAARVHVPPEDVSHRSCYRLDEAACRAAKMANSLTLNVLWPLPSGKTFNYAKLDIGLTPTTLSDWRKYYVGLDLRAFEAHEGRKAEDSPPNGQAGLYLYILDTSSSHPMNTEWCSETSYAYFQTNTQNGHIQINENRTTCVAKTPPHRRRAWMTFLYGERLLVTVDMTDVPLEHWREVLAVASDYIGSIVVQ